MLNIGCVSRINTKKREKILLVMVVISLLLLLCRGSIDAQGNNGYNEDDWETQCKLAISEHQPDKTFSATGEDEAKMNIVIQDRKTNNLAEAQSDIVVLFSSTNGSVKPRTITIVTGSAMSEDISLTSTQPGIAIVTAAAAGFEATSASVKFASPPKPCELRLTAHPNENILADGMHPATLTVKLLNPDDEPFIPQVDTYIDIWTNRGEALPQIKISKKKPYGREEFTTYKKGTVRIIAKSLDFGLEDSTEVTFVSPLTSLTLLLSLVGGFLGGVVKYYQEYRKGLVFLPKHETVDTWRLGMLGHSFFHALFGLIVYVAACLNMPLANLFNLPVDIWSGVFMIGLTGGLFFFAIISLWGILYSRIGR